MINRKIMIIILNVVLVLFLYVLSVSGDDKINIINSIRIINLQDNKDGYIKIDTQYVSKKEITNILLTNDGGIIVCEFYNMKKEEDKSLMINKYGIKVKKYDKRLDIEWKAEIGKKVQNICEIIKEDNDRGYVVAGLSSESVNWKSKRNIQVAFISNAGKIRWVKNYGKMDRKITYIIGGLEIINSDYIILGTEENKFDYKRDGYLLVIDRYGEKIFENKINFNDEIGIKILASFYKNKNILFTGWSINKNILYLSKLALKDHSIIYKYYKVDGNMNNDIYRSNILILDSNGNKMVGGYTYGDSSVYSTFLLKINDDDSVDWFLEFKNILSSCRPTGIIERKNGNYILYGNCSKRGKKYNNSVFMIEIDKEGKIGFMKIFKLGNEWLKVKKIEFDKKGRLIGLFEKEDKDKRVSLIGEIKIK